MILIRGILMKKKRNKEDEYIPSPEEEKIEDGLTNEIDLRQKLTETTFRKLKATHDKEDRDPFEYWYGK